MSFYTSKLMNSGIPSTPHPPPHPVVLAAKGSLLKLLGATHSSKGLIKEGGKTGEKKGEE